MTRCREEGLCRGDSRALWGRGFGGVWSPRPTKRFGGARQRNVGPCALRGTGDADCRVGPAGLLAMTEVDRLSFRGAKRRGNPFHFQRGTGRCGHRPLRPFLGRGTRHAGVVVPYGGRGGAWSPALRSVLAVPGNGSCHTPYVGSRSFDLWFSEYPSGALSGGCRGGPLPSLPGGPGLSPAVRKGRLGGRFAHGRPTYDSEESLCLRPLVTGSAGPSPG